MMMMVGLTARAQETVLPDSTLHLPELNRYGQMPYISSMPMSYMGWYDWQLHKGMNLSIGANVFTSFGKGWKGTGFGQNVSGMYALPLTEKLSLAIGGYFHNAYWSNYTVREAGLSAVLDYRFNEHWEGFVYAQKSLLNNKIPMPVYDHDLGDRIGAAIRYHVNPSIWVQLSVEEHSQRQPFLY